MDELYGCNTLSGLYANARNPFYDLATSAQNGFAMASQGAAGLMDVTQWPLPPSLLEIWKTQGR